MDFEFKPNPFTQILLKLPGSIFCAGTLALQTSVTKLQIAEIDFVTGSQSNCGEG